MNVYTMFYNQFKEFIITFVESLPTENLKIFIKNLTFYSRGDIRSSLLSNIGGNVASGGLNIEEKHQFLQDVFTLCIISFYQTGKLPVSSEKHLDVGDIQLPPDTENFPDTIRLYFQYNDKYFPQSIVSIQAIAMWLYAFNSQHRELVRATMQEYFMNLKYESLQYPKNNMRFYLIESVINNFNYELLRYISELTDKLEARDSSSTYNKFIENEEKVDVTLDNVKMHQREQNLQNEILRENLERQMTK